MRLSMKIRYILISSLILLFSMVLPAWSSLNQVLVAEIAYDQLEPAKQARLDEWVTSTYNELPQAIQNQLNSRYQNTSLFAQLMSVPNTWVSAQKKVMDVKSSDNVNPANTHYKFVSISQHHINQINDLQQRINQSPDSRKKTLYLMQLSTIISPDAQDKNLSNYPEVNQYNIADIAQQIETQFPIYAFNDYLNELYTKDFIKKNKHPDKFVSSTIANPFTNEYQNKLQLNQEKNIALAAYQFSSVLNQLLDNEKNSSLK